MNAILSVHDKGGIVDLGRGLARRAVHCYSTGGTEAVLREHGIPVSPISELTGFPEILGGRVKTLHPRVYGGILALDQPAQLEEAAARGITLIDFVVVNLYPFAQAVAVRAPLEEVLEQIDIGGVTLLRAAAKNFARVTVLSRPEDYSGVLTELERDGSTGLATRRRLALTAFSETAGYDAQIVAYLGQGNAAELPERWVWLGTKAQDLRYGENPHQQAAAYRVGPPGIIGGRQLQGGELSFNNLVDLDAAWRLVREFDQPAAAIIKHMNPCGVAQGATLAQAYAKAYEADPRAAFLGIVAVNGEVDIPTAEAIVRTPFRFEGMVAPGVDPAALAVLARRGKMRVVTVEAGGGMPSAETRTVGGGFLVQTPDRAQVNRSAMRVVTHRAPTDREWEDLLFAWRVAKHVKSNAVVLAQDGCAVGVGAGQMSRVESAELAVRRAGVRAAGSVAASDGFFPYPDGVLALARGGATAIIQPGGSTKDGEAIQVADAAEIAMVFTGIRHFRH